MGIFARLQNIDRRILYVLIAAVIALPLLLRPRSHPRVVFEEVKNAYNTIESIPAGKIAIISTVYGAGTQAENNPQVEALMRHMFKDGTKFVVIGWDPVGADITYDLGKRLEKQYHKQYGVDWVHLGYNPGPIYIVIGGMGRDFKGMFKRDKLNNSLADLPVTRNIVDYRQIGAVAEVTPSATVSYWITYFNMRYGVPLIFCPTAVMAAEAYPFLDSKQIVGMLNGVIGAAQYETLLGMGNERTDAAAYSWALSSAHIFIILLIVLGNAGYALSRRRTQVSAGGRRNGR